MSWQRRSQERNQAPPEHNQLQAPKQLRNVPGCTAIVFLDWPGNFDLDSADPGPQLLSKILAATGRDPASFSVYQVADERPSVSGNVLWFTARPVTPSAEMLLLPSLSSMLADSALKRTAWQSLKPWMAQLP